jgi:2-hydroxy-6-oxonona-2,4-dienedioate hydrolase
LGLIERLARQERAPGESLPLAGRWTRVEGLRLFSRESTAAGSAGVAPVVLVHGFVVSSLYLVPLAGRLARDFTVCVPDLPGFGRSENPRRALDVEGMASALHAWMVASGIGRASLIGNSLGCQTITAFAARWPEMADRLVLLGPTIDPRRRSYHRQIARWLRDGLREKPSIWLVYLHDYLRAGLPRALATSRHMMADRIEERLPLLEMPVMVIRGSRDPLVPRRWGAEAAALLSAGTCHEIPGAAHATNYDAPEQVARLIAPFLQAARSG